ncbi:hypothetical protein DFH11DRAFT_1582156, partial [Phellopilus nigrolimitatus]
PLQFTFAIAFPFPFALRLRPLTRATPFAEWVNDVCDDAFPGDTPVTGGAKMVVWYWWTVGGSGSGMSISSILQELAAELRLMLRRLAPGPPSPFAREREGHWARATVPTLGP